MYYLQYILCDALLAHVCMPSYPVSLCQEYNLDPLAIQVKLVKAILVESLLMLIVLFNGWTCICGGGPAA